MGAEATLADAEARFAHASNKLLAVSQYIELTGKRLLDIGCGLGNGVLAALGAGAAMAVGVDINLSDFGYNHFSELAAAHRLDLTRAMLIECDFSRFRVAHPGFDVVLCIDVIEHVADPGGVIAKIHDHLNPGGLALIDTSPLYYSQLGHHLFAYFPRDETAWAHLRADFDELAGARNIDAWSLERFRELNRTTYGQLRASLLGTGFEIVAEHRGLAGEDVLDRVMPRLALPPGVGREDLLSEWAYFMVRKPAVSRTGTGSSA